MQCDWLTAEVSPGWIIDPLKEAGEKLYDTGRVLVLSPDGQVREQWAGAELVASHDTNLRVKSPDGFALWLSGNPVKWLQGHNLFGSEDVLGLTLCAGLLIRERVGLFPGPETFKANGYTMPRFTRVDLTRSYRFPSNEHARAWLRDVASYARSRHGAPLFKGSTVEWGKKSSHWSMVAYLKADELQARGKSHKLSEGLSARDRRILTAWAQGVVRFEVRLRRLELQGFDPSAQEPLSLWQDYFDRITFNRNTQGADMIDNALPNHLAGYRARWEQGEDLRASLKRANFYKVRKQLLDAAGIDIAAPPPDKSAVAVTPATLDPAGWDPEPIEELLYRPDGTLARQYGLNV